MARLEATMEHWKAETKLKGFSRRTLLKVALLALRRGDIKPRFVLRTYDVRSAYPKIHMNAMYGKMGRSRAI